MIRGAERPASRLGLMYFIRCLSVLSLQMYGCASVVSQEQSYAQADSLTDVHYAIHFNRKSVDVGFRFPTGVRRSLDPKEKQCLTRVATTHFVLNALLGPNAKGSSSTKANAESAMSDERISQLLSDTAHALEWGNADSRVLLDELPGFLDDEQEKHDLRGALQAFYLEVSNARQFARQRNGTRPQKNPAFGTVAVCSGEDFIAYSPTSMSSTITHLVAFHVGATKIDECLTWTLVGDHYDPIRDKQTICPPGYAAAKRVASGVANVEVPSQSYLDFRRIRDTCSSDPLLRIPVR